MSFSESFVARPSTMTSKPVACGSSVPQCPAFLILNPRRRDSTTSCEVGPAGLSTSNAPSSGENSSIPSACPSERALDLPDHATLRREGAARNSCACGGRVASSTKSLRDFVYTHLLALGTEAYAGQFRFQFLEHACHNNRFDGADVIDQPFRVILPSPGAREIGFLQPEVGDLVLLSQPELVQDALQQTDARQRI